MCARADVIPHIHASTVGEGASIRVIDDMTFISLAGISGVRRRSRRHSHRMIETLIEMSEVHEQMLAYIHVKRIVLPAGARRRRVSRAAEWAAFATSDSWTNNIDVSQQ